jgi:hypothetical protein
MLTLAHSTMFAHSHGNEIVLAVAVVVFLIAARIWKRS